MSGPTSGSVISELLDAGVQGLPLRALGRATRALWGADGAAASGSSGAQAGSISYLSKRTDTRSIATITDSLSGVAGLGSEVLPGLTFSFPGTDCSPTLLEL